MSQLPFISIIIPVLNAQDYIGPCLEALLRQDYEKDKYEIIVLDNGSWDKTMDIIRQYPVKVIVKSHCNISALRNWGVGQAAGEIFAFIDADCIAPQDWLSQARLLLQKDRAGAAGCWYALPESTTLLERVWDILTSLRRERIGPVDWVPSGDLIVPKNVFEEINGFDEFLITSEDVDICQRVIKTGRVVYSHPHLAVVHLGNPKSLKQFFLKEKWRGEGVLQNSLRRFPRLELNRAIIFGFLSLFFAFGLLAGTIRWIMKGQSDLLFFSLAGLMFIPAVLTIKTLLKRSGWNQFFILLFLFIVYGIARASSVFSLKVWRNFQKG